MWWSLGVRWLPASHKTRSEGLENSDSLDTQEHQPPQIFWREPQTRKMSII